jgi:steroid delta-isomerase-like uncharacterized protein
LNHALLSGKPTREGAMSNTEIFRRWFEEVWNQGREATIDAMFAPAGIAYGLGGPDEHHRGPAAFKPFWAQLRNAFPDIRFAIDDTVEQGDLVAGRWSAAMTHTGDGLGVPATQKPLSITGMSFMRIADGQIVEAWNNWDQHVLVRELGLA